MGANKKAVGPKANLSGHRRFCGAAHGGGHARMLAVDLPPELGGEAIAAEWGGPSESLVGNRRNSGGAQ